MTQERPLSSMSNGIRESTWKIQNHSMRHRACAWTNGLLRIRSRHGKRFGFDVQRRESFKSRVWVREGRKSTARRCHLILTRELGSQSTSKDSLSNAPAEMLLMHLAYIQRQRYWVERIFQDAKNEAGMDEYQARTWRAWHHHMALVMMVMLFLLRERLAQSHDLSLLSVRDVKILLARVLPRRDAGPDELIRLLQARHRQRQAALDSAYRRPSNAYPTIRSEGDN